MHCWALPYVLTAGKSLQVMLGRAALFGALTLAAIASARADDVQLPLAGRWRTDSVEVHYDAKGRVRAILGEPARRLSGESCMSAGEAATIYSRNPQPSCWFDVRQQGGGLSRTVIDCSGGGFGARYDITRRITPTTIDMKTVLTWPDRSREETTSHGVRIGACPPA